MTEKEIEDAREAGKKEGHAELQMSNILARVKRLENGALVILVTGATLYLKSKGLLE